MMPNSPIATIQEPAGKYLVESSAETEESTHVPPTFEQAYKECFSFVWRTAKRMGIPDEHLDDACQEVFVVVHRKLDQFEGRAQLKTWIYRIVTNVVRNQRRSHGRKSVHAQSRGEVLDPEDLDGDLPGPEALVTRREATSAAREILMGMSEKKRMAFVLVDLEGMSFKEAADSTGESLHTVRSRVRAAREEFERLSRRLQNVAGWATDE